MIPFIKSFFFFLCGIFLIACFYPTVSLALADLESLQKVLEDAIEEHSALKIADQDEASLFSEMNIERFRSNKFFEELTYTDEEIDFFIKRALEAGESRIKYQNFILENLSVLQHVVKLYKLKPPQTEEIDEHLYFDVSIFFSSLLDYRRSYLTNRRLNRLESVGTPCSIPSTRKGFVHKRKWDEKVSKESTLRFINSERLLVQLAPYKKDPYIRLENNCLLRTDSYLKDLINGKIKIEDYLSPDEALDTVSFISAINDIGQNNETFLDALAPQLLYKSVSSNLAEPSIIQRKRWEKKFPKEIKDFLNFFYKVELNHAKLMIKKFIPRYIRDSCSDYTLSVYSDLDIKKALGDPVCRDKITEKLILYDLNPLLKYIDDLYPVRERKTVECKSKKNKKKTEKTLVNKLEKDFSKNDFSSVSESFPVNHSLTASSSGLVIGSHPQPSLPFCLPETEMKGREEEMDKRDKKKKIPAPKRYHYSSPKDYEEALKNYKAALSEEAKKAQVVTEITAPMTQALEDLVHLDRHERFPYFEYEPDIDNLGPELDEEFDAMERADALFEMPSDTHQKKISEETQEFIKQIFRIKGEYLKTDPTLSFLWARLLRAYREMKWVTEGISCARPEPLGGSAYAFISKKTEKGSRVVLHKPHGLGRYQGGHGMEKQVRNFFQEISWTPEALEFEKTF